MPKLQLYNGNQWVEIAKNGKDAPIIDIDAIVQKVISLIPVPKDGKDALSAQPLDLVALKEELKEMITNLVKEHSYKPRLLGGNSRLPLRTIVITGAVNGTNDTFTLDKDYNYVALYWNGQLQQPTTHYTRAGKTCTFTAGNIPTAGTLHGFAQ